MTRSTDKQTIESESVSSDGLNEFIFFLVWNKKTKNFQKFLVEGEKVFEDFEKGHYLPNGHDLASAKKLRITVEVVA